MRPLFLAVIALAACADTISPPPSVDSGLPGGDLPGPTDAVLEALWADVPEDRPVPRDVPEVPRDRGVDTGAADVGTVDARACPTGLEDCDGDPINGCEAFTTSNLQHCGGCGMACTARPHSAANCVAGACVYACAPDFGDCDGDPVNGCETDLDTSPAHCGGCGYACTAPWPRTVATCTAGGCASRCVDGYTDCDGASTNGCETDPRTSATHCGACGVVCAAGQRCEASACVVDMDSGADVPR